jgi:hypothetical protein
LESRVQSLLSAGGGSAASATAAALSGISSFDPDQYVSGVVANARNRSESDRQQAISTAENVIGGTVDSNSAAALLASRINNDANANLAGIESDAVAKAQSILGNNIAAAGNARGQDDNLLTQLAGILKGGVTTGTAVGNTATAGQTNQEQQQTGTTTESSNQQQNSQQQTQQDVLSQLISLLQGTENTKGTEQANAVTKSGGFGLSI